MENLVGRKVKCLESYYGVTKGKEYTISNIDNSGFYIAEDDGKKRRWCTSHLHSKTHFELIIDEWQPKQGDKVLVSNYKSHWAEGEFITEYKNEFIVKFNDEIIGRKYIKPYEDEIKVGDWVKRISDETIWKIRDKDDVNVALNSECTKITNLELIKLLNKEL